MRGARRLYLGRRAEGFEIDPIEGLCSDVDHVEWLLVRCRPAIIRFSAKLLRRRWRREVVAWLLGHRRDGF